MGRQRDDGYRSERKSLRNQKRCHGYVHVRCADGRVTVDGWIQPIYTVAPHQRRRALGWTTDSRSRSLHDIDQRCDPSVQSRILATRPQSLGISPKGEPEIRARLQVLISIYQASWDEVILSDEFKHRVQNDYRSFFKSEKTYKDLSVPWKRGLIFLGVSATSLHILLSQGLMKPTASWERQDGQSESHHEGCQGTSSIRQEPAQ